MQAGDYVRCNFPFREASGPGPSPHMVFCLATGQIRYERFAIVVYTTSPGAMTDLFELQRFVDAQAPVYRRVTAELRQGHKQSHWMWFIFPQLAGLGHSPMAERYAIASREEAVAYLEHGILGPRLRECTALVNAVEDRTIREILGSPDDLKFCSSMTLFGAVSSDAVLADAIAKFYGGRPDRRTLDLLAA